MRTVAEHQEAVRALLAPLAHRDAVDVVGVDAAGLAGSRDMDRVLADDVASPIDHPPFDNSQMDGYAVRSDEAVPGRVFAVAARIAAGDPVRTLEPGTAAPIMTGAAVPVGADAIVPIEASIPDSFLPEGGKHTVEFSAPAIPGAFVRPRGSDLESGRMLLPAGTRLGAAQWGVLAASGIREVRVRRRLHVLVLSTGDELREAGDELDSGQIFDANSATMAIGVTECGAAVADVRTVTDDAAALGAYLAAHGRSADLILTTGGVSKGAYEVVRDVFEPAGVTFSSVAMQPGGPQGLGLATLTDDAGVRFERPVVAFPGNPVSALVSFEMFLRPVLRELDGLSPRRPSSLAYLAEPLVSPGGKHQVRRGRLDYAGAVELVGGASSHLLHGYATSTLLVHVPLGVSHLNAGAPVETWSID